MKKFVAKTLMLGSVVTGIFKAFNQISESFIKIAKKYGTSKNPQS